MASFTWDRASSAQRLLSSMTADDSVENVENEADEEESAVGEVLIPESCVL
jgi:hypothetical protein